MKDSKRRGQEVTSLTHSIMLPIPEDDFEMVWEINKATGELDTVAKKMGLGEVVKTWVGGMCYYDYDNLHEEEYDISKKSLQLSINRKYKWK